MEDAYPNKLINRKLEFASIMQHSPYTLNRRAARKGERARINLMINTASAETSFTAICCSIMIRTIDSSH